MARESLALAAQAAGTVPELAVVKSGLVQELE
jgi:hypothetical protein